MKNLLVIIFFWFAASVVHAQVTYAPTVGNYIQVLDFTSCPSGEACTNYTTAMRQTGSFTVPTVLAPNLSDADIAGLVSSYTFSDGINTYSNANAEDRIYAFFVSTDGAGNIIGSLILLEKWLSGVNGSHVPGDRFSYMFVGLQSTNNAVCGRVFTSLSGVPDACDSDLGGAGTSSALAQSVRWSRVTAPTPIPTLSEWAMIIMASLMAMFAIGRMHRL